MNIGTWEQFPSMCVFDSKTTTWANWSQIDAQTNHKLKSPATILKNKELLHQKFRDLMEAWFYCLFLKLRRASPAVPSKYVTQMQKYFSHPSLLFSFFPTPPTKLKLGLGILCNAAGYTLQILTYTLLNVQWNSIQKYTRKEDGKSKPARAHRQTSQMEERARMLCFSLLRARVYKGELWTRGAESFTASVCFREASIRR